MSQRYMLFRDRKSLLANSLNMVANIFIPIMLFFALYPYFFPQAYRFPSIMTDSKMLTVLLGVNAFLFFWRIILRGLYVSKMYGPLQGLLSFPRLFWGNIINFFAVMRAIKLFLYHRWTGKPIAWDKTDHVFPNEDELKAYRRRLGDLLLDRRIVTVAQIDEAVAKQKETGKPLGEILCTMGAISKEDLDQILALQAGKISSQMTKPLDFRALKVVEKEISNRLGEFFVTNHKITQAQLEEALRIHKQKGERLGKVLIDQNFITNEDLEKALNWQKEERQSHT